MGNRELLQSEANRVGDEYVQTAYRLTELYLQLLGLNAVAEEAGAPLSIKYNGWDSYLIPAFSLPACAAVTSPKNPALLFAKGTLTGVNNAFRAAEARERERLKALGLKLA